MNNNQKNKSKFWGLVRWSLIRHKYYIPVFVMVQIILSIAIIYGFTPLFGLWLSIMAATPVFCELRYIYGLFTCIPLLIITPIILKSKKD